LFTSAEIGGDSTERVRSQYTDAVAGEQTGQNFPRIAADSDGRSTVRVRTEYGEYRRPAAEATRRPRRDYRESTEIVERVRMEYGQRGHSTDVLFKYGHSTDICDVRADLQSPYL